MNKKYIKYFCIIIFILTGFIFIFNNKSEFPIKESYTYFIGENSDKKISIKSDDYAINKPITDFISYGTILSSEQIQIDSAYSLHAFKYGYSGYNFIDRKKINKIEAGLKILMTQKISLTKIEFFEKLYALFEIIPDRHLEIQTDNGKLNQQMRDKYNTHKIINVGKNIASESKLWKVSKDKNILSIGIKYCEQPESDKWNGFFETVSKNMQNINTVIFDLRGNPGGNSQNPEKLISYLCNVKNIDTSNSEAFYRMTPEARLFLYNIFVQLDLSPSVISTLWNDYQNVKNKKIKFQNQLKYIADMKSDLNNYANNFISNFDGKLIILQDEHVMSSTETTIRYAKDVCKNLTTIGTNTHGGNHFFDTGIVILPNSKLTLVIPTGYTNTKPFIEMVGFTPDIKVDDNQNAYEVAIKYANK